MLNSVNNTRQEQPRIEDTSNEDMAVFWGRVYDIFAVLLRKVECLPRVADENALDKPLLRARMPAISYWPLLSVSVLPISRYVFIINQCSASLEMNEKERIKTTPATAKHCH